MLPKTGEWAELGILLVLGPLHAFGCVILTAIAFWLAPRWTTTARVTLLLPNVMIACVPVVVGLSVGSEDASWQSLARAVATFELLTVSGLAAVLIARRRA